MAIYRNVQLSFWTDNKVEDNFTPEDKYFYLYLLTNPQTNICGCYEVSYKQMTQQLGYDDKTIDRLLERFESFHNMIRFSKDTKEILILNWYKYNWSKSEKTLVGVENVAKHIKSKEFKDYIFSVIDCIRKNAPYKVHICPIQASVSDTDTVINNIVSNYTSVDNNNLYNGKSDSFNAEKAWQDTFAIYPKKSGADSAKIAWMDKLIQVAPSNQKIVAQLIYKATKAYLADYESNNPSDTRFQYIPKYENWLKCDCDYWISVVEKGK